MDALNCYLDFYFSNWLYPLHILFGTVRTSDAGTKNFVIGAQAGGVVFLESGVWY